MQRKFERIKSGSSCGLNIDDKSFIEALDEIITCELSFGAQIEILENSVVFKTKVFGDIDNTEFTGNAAEMQFIKAMLNEWLQNGRMGLQDHLLKSMLMSPTVERFNFKDLISALELFIGGAQPHELAEILTPIKPKDRIPQSLEVSADLYKQYKELDNDDGVKLLIGSLILQSI